MIQYAVMDEVFDVMTNGSFERLTAQQLTDAYFRQSERDAQTISIFDSEENALSCLETLELCPAKKIDFYSGLVHIAFVQQIDDGVWGAVIKSRIDI